MPTPPLSLLRAIAKAIHTQQECVDLASELGIDDDDVIRVLKLDPPKSGSLDQLTTLAMGVLVKWTQQSDDATGEALLVALGRIGRKDLVRKFRYQLLGRETQGWSRSRCTLNLCPSGAMGDFHTSYAVRKGRVCASMSLSPYCKT